MHKWHEWPFYKIVSLTNQKHMKSYSMSLVKEKYKLNPLYSIFKHSPEWLKFKKQTKWNVGQDVD